MNALMLRTLNTLVLSGLWIGLLGLHILPGRDFFESSLEEFHGSH